MMIRCQDIDFFFYDFLTESDCEIVSALKELCTDFVPYNFLKKYDLYKGSLFGGTNIYFKRGMNNDCGMVTTKTNIRKYGLEKFPFNFQTACNRNGIVEQGWSGEMLMAVIESLQSYKSIHKTT